MLWAGSSFPFSLLLSHFRFGQTWSETKTLQIVLESFCVHSPAHSSFSREAPLSCPPSPPWNLSFFTVESILFYPCSRSDFPLAKMWLSLTLTLLHLTIWCFGQTALFLFLLAKAALAYLPAAFSVALSPHYLFRRPSMFKFFRWSLRHSARSLLDSAALTSLPLLSSIWLFSIFPFTSISLVDLAGTVFSLLLFYQATIDLRTLVSPGERRGWWAVQTASATHAFCNPL